jgi:hypothetical protein
MALAVLLAAGWLTFVLVQGSGSARHSANRGTRTTTSLGTVTTSTQPPATTTTAAPATTTTAPATTTTAAPATTTTTTSPTTTTRPLSTTTTTTTLAVLNPPRITSLNPGHGGYGSSVTITGANFYSPGGSVTAYFGGKPQDTACPSQDRCTVKIVNMSGPTRTVTVVVTTNAGTSNSETFTYVKR